MCECKARFYDLSNYTDRILPTKHERMYYFIKVLRLQHNLSIKSIVSLHRSFLDIVNHAYIMKDLHHKSYEDKDKRSFHQGSYSGT